MLCLDAEARLTIDEVLAALTELAANRPLPPR